MLPQAFEDGMKAVEKNEQTNHEKLYIASRMWDQMLRMFGTRENALIVIDMVDSITTIATGDTAEEVE